MSGCGGAMASTRAPTSSPRGRIEPPQPRPPPTRHLPMISSPSPGGGRAPAEKEGVTGALVGEGGAGRTPFFKPVTRPFFRSGAGAAVDCHLPAISSPVSGGGRAPAEKEGVTGALVGGGGAGRTPFFRSATRPFVRSRAGVAVDGDDVHSPRPRLIRSTAGA
jgi:hypothetical protein